MIPSCMRQPLPLDEAVGIIEQLKVRVQDVNQRKERYKLISDSGGPNPVMEMTQPATTGSWFDMLAEARSTTRKQRDMDDLTNLVARTGSDRQVISVWVSGGNLGAASKSIVRKAYDNTKIWGNFSYRAWVNVNLGNPFNLKEFLRSLMDQFSDDGSIPPVAEGLEDLITKIKEKVNNKTYLVVLEDLSTNVCWDTILKYLSDGGNGGRIVVLTQQFQVASLCIPLPYIPSFWSDYSLCVFSEDKEGPLVGHMSEVNQLSAYLAKARLNALQVISVYGIPAAGKSALVRNLYRKMMSQNNEYTKYIWVVVHHPFNLVDFCKSILMQFRSCSLRTDEDPVKNCHGLLKDQQCLLVIDNLQSTEDWDLIHGTLAFRPSGSAIVVITNEERIALHCADRKDLVFHVKPLEAGAAIDLFKIKTYICIRRRRLVMRWGAEGYSTDCESYTADENGEELFSRLVKETMIQRLPRTTITNTRMVSFEVNAMFREYMISRPLQQNIATAIELSALKGTCSPTSRRRGRHLVIEQSWDRDRIVFKNIDFSRLRSLTVFGNGKNSSSLKA